MGWTGATHSVVLSGAAVCVGGTSGNHCLSKQPQKYAYMRSFVSKVLRC